jgi:hypothetical protein
MSCPKCRNREQRRHTYRLQTYGHWQPWGDLNAVIEHLDYLRRHRVGVKRIEELTGLSRSTIFRIRSGGSKKITRHVADTILAVQPEQTLRVDPTGTQRRIRALMALGWSTYYIADRLGYTQARVWELSKGRRWVKPPTYAAVSRLYEELSMKQGPSDITRSRARRAGHAPPLAWGNIDDPGERPRGVLAAPSEACAVEGCVAASVSRGWCETHYRRWLKGRDLSAPLRRPSDAVDPVVVERLLAGEQVESTRAEKDAAMRRWKAMGRSEASLCKLHGWHEGRYGRGEDAA